MVIRLYVDELWIAALTLQKVLKVKRIQIDSKCRIVGKLDFVMDWKAVGIAQKKIQSQ